MKKRTFFIILIFISQCSYAEGNSSIAYNQRVFLQWKKSLLEAVDSFTKKENDGPVGNFRIVANYIDSSIFDTLTVVLHKHFTKERFKCYILINDINGEFSTTDIILRAYYKKQGIEIKLHFFQMTKKNICTEISAQ